MTATNGPLARALVVVDRARDQLLAGAALAGDEHGGLSGGDTAGAAEQFVHRRRLEHQLAALQRRTQILDLGLQPAAFVLGAHPVQVGEMLAIEGDGELRGDAGQHRQVALVEVERLGRADQREHPEHAASGHQRHGDAHRRASGAGAVAGSERHRTLADLAAGRGFGNQPPLGLGDVGGGQRHHTAGPQLLPHQQPGPGLVAQEQPDAIGPQ